MVTSNSLIGTWIGDLLVCMGGCFGCCTKPTPVIAVDQPSKGLRIQGRKVRKPSISDDFWSTTSTYDLESIAFQSQKSLSSIGTSNPTPSQCSSTGGLANSAFVNQGLVIWNQTRLQWIGSRTRNPFPRPVPLSEMIDFLVEVWEQEGLYD
ncbi:hypothetical protein V6N11_026799 [Hibiscus sabdariffa]|uniref:Gag1-like clamp domain-containing protein n=1 Tax=Hibiscus sabdariffa TaxID=183260 RepID=A0ABR2SXJ6_9ROSI